MEAKPTQMWFPAHWQLRYWENPNRWNSLWLGTIWMVAMAPRAFWWHFGGASFPYSLVMFALWVRKTVAAGIAGELHCEDVTPEEIQRRLEVFKSLIDRPNRDQ